MEEVALIPKRKQNVIDTSEHDQNISDNPIESANKEDSNEFIGFVKSTKQNNSDELDTPDYIKQNTLTEENSNFITYTKNNVLANMGNNLYGNSISKTWDMGLEATSHVEAAAHGKLAPVSSKDVSKSMQQYQKWATIKDTTDRFNKKVSQDTVNKIVNFGSSEESPPIETEEDFKNAIEIGVNNIESSSGKEFSYTYGEILNEEKANALNTSFADVNTLREIADIDNSSPYTPIANFLKKWKKKTGTTLSAISQEAKEKIALADAYGDVGLVKQLAATLTTGAVDLLADPFKLMAFNTGAKGLESLVTSTFAKHVVVGTGFSTAGVVTNWIYSDNYTMEEAAIEFALGVGFYAAPIAAAYGVKGTFKGGKFLKDLVVKPNPKVDKSFRDNANTAWEYNTSETNAKTTATESGITNPTGDLDFPNVKILNEEQTAFISLEKESPIIKNIPTLNERAGIKLTEDGSDFKFIRNTTVNPKYSVVDGVNIPEGLTAESAMNFALLPKEKVPKELWDIREKIIKEPEFIDKIAKAPEATSIPRTAEEIQASIRQVAEDNIRERSLEISQLTPEQMPKALQEAGKGISRIQATIPALYENQTLELRTALLTDKKISNELLAKLNSKSKKYDKQLEKDFLHTIITEDPTIMGDLPKEYQGIARGYITANQTNLRQQHGVGIVKTKAENYSSPKFAIDKINGNWKEFTQSAEENIDWKLMQKRELKKLTYDLKKLKKAQAGVNNKEITILEKKITRFSEKGYTEGEKTQIATGYYNSLIDSAHNKWSVEGQMSNVERKHIFIRPDKFSEFSRTWGDDVNLLHQMDNKLQKDAMNTAVHMELGAAPSKMLDMYMKHFRPYKEKGVVAKWLPGNYFQDLVNLSDAFTARRRMPETPSWLDRIGGLVGALTQSLQLRNIIRYPLVEEMFRASLLNKAFGRNKSENTFAMVSAHFVNATPAQRAILAQNFFASALPGRRGSGWDINNSSRNVLPGNLNSALSLGAHHITNSNKTSATLYFQHLTSQFLQKDINKLTTIEKKDLSQLDITPEMLRWAKKHQKEGSYTLNNPFGGEGGELISFSSTYNKYLQEGDTKNANMALKWLSSSKKAVQTVVPESQTFQEFAAKGDPGTQTTLNALLKYNPMLYLTGAARTISKQIADLNNPGFYKLNSPDKFAKLGNAMWEWHEMNLMIGMAIDHLKQFAQGDLTDTEETAQHFLSGDYDKMVDKMQKSYLHGQMIGGMVGWFGEIALGAALLGKSLFLDPNKTAKQKAKEFHFVNDFVSPVFEGVVKGADIIQHVAQLFGEESPQAIANLKKDLWSTSSGDMKHLPLDLMGLLGNRFIVDKMLPLIDSNEMLKAMVNSEYAQNTADASEKQNKKDKASRKKAIAKGARNRDRETFNQER